MTALREHIEDLRGQIDGIVDEIIDISYFMRGSVDYFQMYELTRPELQRMARFLERRFEEESKKPAMANRVY
jgi:hypothetical protein